MNAKVQSVIDGVFASDVLNRFPEEYGGGRIFSRPSP